MLVYRPVDAAKFSGTVVVEWNNVTAQMDVPIDFNWLYPQIFASGDAYVEISAQQAGVCGLGLTGQPVITIGHTSAAVCTPVSLKGWDPIRYSPLVLPGDQYSFDIYAQGARAVAHPEGVAPLGQLVVRHTIAIGESQSAEELDKFIRNGADAATKVFAGFVIDADVHQNLPTAYRVPTLHIWGEESARPVPSTTGPNHVIWEVAGAPHFDYWALAQVEKGTARNLLDTPANSARQEAAAELAEGDYSQEGLSLGATCIGDSQFPRRYAVDAAMADMEVWTSTGTPAPSAPPLRFTGFALSTQSLPLGISTPGLPESPIDGQNVFALVTAPLALVRDSNGNAVGGLRLPVVTVPVASYNGPTCVLLGISVPFLPTRLRQLYPSHADYVAKMIKATQAAVHERYLTAADGIDLVRRACASAIPSWGTTPARQQPVACRQLEGLIRRSDVISAKNSPRP